MTKINEFYLSKHGRACHMDLQDVPKFIALGLDAIIYGKDNIVNLYNKSKEFSSSISIKTKNLIDATTLSLHQKIDNVSADKKHKFKEIGLLGVASCFIIGAIVFNTHHNKLLNPSNNPKHIGSYTQAPKVKHEFLGSFFSSKLEAFTNLLLITEGKSTSFSLDNKGVMGGYGWNPTTTPKSLNKIIAKAMGMNSKEQKAIEEVSEKRSVDRVPKNLKKVVFSEKQLAASADVMMSVYEKEFLNVLKVKSVEKNQNYADLRKGYNSLPFNQQAVLLHMTYKVGAKNLLKYNDFFDTLITYIEDPSDNNLKTTSNSFEYSYKKRDGEKVHDIRVENTHQAFFSDCVTAVDKEQINANIKSCRKMVKIAEKKARNPS